MLTRSSLGKNAFVDDLQRLRAWSYARQRLREPARSLAQALDSVVAVYATHPTAPLALWARTKSFRSADYRRFDRVGKGVRFPAMRATVFLVPTEHAARIFTATHPSAPPSVRRLTRLEISEEAYERLTSKILSAALQPASKKQLEETTGIQSSEMAALLRGLRIEGRILSLAGESLLSSPHRFVATLAWVPGGLDAGDPAESLAWLAGRYLRGYGPVRTADFAWWAGVSQTAAKGALAEHHTIDVGEGRHLLADEEASFAKAEPLRNEIALLPKWDAYTMGLGPDGRQRFVHPDVQARVYTPIGTGLAGDGNPMVLVDGEAVATWTFSLKAGADLQPFDKLGAKTKKRVDEKLDEITALLRT
jgi:Winged helix DNA-binding domain